MRKTWALVMAAAMAAASLTACSSSKPAETAAPETEAEAAETEETEAEAEATGDQQEILVAAAASLQYVMEDKIQPAFEKENPDIKLSFTFDSSGKLQTQIEEGADADVFFSAAMKQMNALEDEGLVVRKRGKGTFVADPNNNRRGVRYSFTTEVSSLGKTPSSTLVDFGVVIPTRAICQRMDLQEGTPVYCFTRVRNVDGEPLILETSYYPQYIYPNLTREMVQTHSFYSLLYHVGITPFSAEDSYESVILDAPRASLLGVEPGSCAFYHQRRTRTEDGRIYEYTRSYIRGDRVRLDVHMQKSGMSFTRTID